MPEPCKTCGNWVCLDCGAKRYRANRFYPKKHECPKCRSTNGEMRPLTHMGRMDLGDREEYDRLIKDGFKVYYPLEES